MHRLPPSLVCLLLLWSVRSPAAEPKTPPAPAQDHARDRIILKFKPSANDLVAGVPSGPGLARLVRRLGLPQGAVLKETAMTRWLKSQRANAPGRPAFDPDALPVDLDRFQLLHLPPGLTVEDCLARLRGHPLLDYAEADGLGTGGEIIPSDPSFSQQWHHRNTAKPGADIATPRAWDFSTGSVAVTVAVLDTGLAATLPEFAGRVAAGYDFVNSDNDPADDHGHGTAVAGTLAANANNGALGAGVDWACRLMPVKVLDQNNSGLYADWAQGIDFAVANGAKVINLSAGGSSTSTTLTRAIDNAIAHGVIFVTITHNDGLGVIRYPGSLAQCITVGATTQSDTRATFSNWGPAIDLVAPGQNIYTVNRNGTLGSWGGTSFAAPLVAGVCALMASVRPQINQADAQLYLTLGAEDRVGGAEDTPGFDPYFGWGRLNGYQSLSKLVSEPPNLSVAQSESADPAPIGCLLTYTLTVFNNSLTTLTGIRLTNTLPAAAVFSSASASQGVFQWVGQRVVFGPILLQPRAKAVFTVTVEVAAEGMLTSQADVVASEIPYNPALHHSEEVTAAVLDTAGPVLLSVAALPDGRTVRLLFSEALDAASATNTAHYTVSSGQGNDLVIQGASMGSGPAEVLLGVELLGSLAPFTVQARDVVDCTGNPMASLAQAEAALPAFKLAASGADWRYLDDGSNQGTAWRLPAFSDAAWAFGPSQLGYGDNDEATVVDFGPDPNNKRITTYFRLGFDVPDTNVLTNVVLRLLRDDGAVVYLNGQEVFRSNMPAGAPAYNTLAAAAVNDSDELTFFETTLPREKLLPGLNVFAVEIHQSDAASSDLSFDLELTAQLMRYALPPAFARHPEPVTAVQGDTVRFQAEVTGTPPFGYRWRRGSVTVANFGVAGPLLTLDNIQPAQAGSYTVVATNIANPSPGVLSQSAQLTVLPDTDGDHVPDAWESDHQLDPADPLDGSQDADGDLYSNLEEYLAGTDPRDADDFFRIGGIVSEGDGVSLSFTAASNRTYTVWHRDPGMPGVWHRLVDVPAHPTNRVVEIQDTQGAGVHRLYRLAAPRFWLIP